MFGFGAAEGVIVLVILLVLFAPTLIAFWLGYTLGTKKSARPPEQGSVDRAPVDPAEDEAPREEPTND